MKRIISLLFSSFFLCMWTTFAQAQELNPSNVIRISNCTIDEGYTLQEVVDRARELSEEDSDNQPDGIYFRQPIYTSAEYQENWDFQLALYYPSYVEMASRRIAAGNSSRGRLPISCGNATTINSYVVHQGDSFPNQTGMLTRFCRLDEGNLRSSYNRIGTIAENYAEAGSNLSVQMNVRGLGGQLQGPNDYGIAVVGSSIEAVMERLDMRRNGFRAELGNRSSSGASCDRWSLWVTHRIFQTNN